MRVISGTAGGLHLKAPKRHPLRPTQDRIRQVIFSSLAERVPEARVLDLFAGTGSLGIEALSRGAISAIFVERETEAAQCIRDNLTHCKLKGDVRAQEIESFLSESGHEKKFDLVFADPPYLKNRNPLDDDWLLSSIPAVLAPDGIFVWEHYAGRELEDSTSWTVIRQRNYGETGLTFLKLNT
jgi:16S rRNA (guanine966-N2)-methyltransferase